MKLEKNSVFQLFPYRYSSLILLIFFFLSCKQNKEENIGKYVIADVQQKRQLSEKEYENRGKYLVEILGCHDCHSPKKMGERGPELISELAFSGFQANTELPKIDKQALENGWMLMNSDLTAFVGPWGISYSANLTPHDTGIGSWNFEQFKRAMVEGKYKGLQNGRMLLPPMPWQNFKEVKDDDLRAMYTYFKSLEPIENIVPSPKSLAELQ
ncbi:diheme cytochrome c-553 [Salegentibacter sp. JZCK2]|uniref:diheme cytochrome c-553 n=1 Tax=Salegentibacter tibetensis TaxID=2873600 RepID=UPI001CCA5C37|nr:diheme cytochrome c-553 [Salegentibacter tibetensis]MBZ9730796.1 diheme cytochrome c-553 [Salegentibacter tibetensis]